MSLSVIGVALGITSNILIRKYLPHSSRLICLRNCN